MNRGYFWCIIICYLWPRIILWGRQNFDNYRKCGVRICNNELAALDELVWAHYAVCQYQLKGQFYVTTCSHCFKPFCCNTPCQYTPLLNLCSLLFSLWFWLAAFYYAYSCLNLLCIVGYHFRFISFWFIPTFSGMQLGHRTRACCVYNF